MPPLGRQGPLDDEVRWDEPDWLPDDETSIREADALGSAGAALALGLLLHQRGDLEGAEDCLWRADGRGSADAAWYVGALLQDRGQAHEALAAYHRADGRGSAEGAWAP